MKLRIELVSRRIGINSGVTEWNSVVAVSACGGESRN